jgi:group I intron endonuclease
MLNSGVYCIKNKVNGKVYVGSSVNVRRRWQRHTEDLVAGKHHSRYLQRAWSKYGVNNFEFLMLEGCVQSQLLIREDYWISSFCSADYRFGYNLQSTPSRGNFGLKDTDEARKKKSLAGIARFKDPAERARTAEALRKACADPGVKARKSAHTKKTWTDPTTRAKRQAAISIAAKKRYSDPVERARASVLQKALTNTPERRAAYSAVAKAWWQDPVSRGKYRQTIIFRRQARKEAEKKCIIGILMERVKEVPSETH